MRIEGSAASTIQGNYIGVDTSGTAGLPNSGSGVFVVGCGSANTIGGTAAGARNVISGNTEQGVELNDSDGQLVQGNYIGLAADGATIRPNSACGIYLTSNANTNTIGGTAAGAGNVISGNGSWGIEIENSDGNNLQGNLIGTDSGGTQDRGNAQAGVLLFSGSDNNTVGGTTAAARNTISGNNLHGVYINQSSTNDVQGNYIGTTAAGTASLGNSNNGIYIMSNADTNTIGGTTAGHRNIISGNGETGVRIDTSTGNTVLGNYIGTDVNGTADLGNTQQGVYVGSDTNTIGGTAAGSRNVISGNDQNGVYVTTSTGNTLLGNYIGTDASGTADLGNAQEGVYLLNGSDSSTVGGSAAGENLIRFNDLNGVLINGSSTNEVSHNQVKDNTDSGVLVEAGAYQNRIHENSIYGNGDLGIKLTGDGNHNYAAPVITSAFWDGASADVIGTATPDAEVEIFATGPVPDPSGSGEGLTFLATVTATGGTFNQTVTGVALGDEISCVAICPAGDPNVGDTSQFSTNGAVEWPPPEVTGINPAQGNRGQILTGVQIDGSDFRGPNGNVIAQLKNGAETITGTVTNVAATQITADFTIPVDATLGLWDVYVQQVDDGKNDTLAGAFDVQYPPPVVTGINPAQGNRGQTLTGVLIDGSDFRGPNGNVIAQLKNGAETITGTVTGVTDTLITADFTIPAGATVGLWDVYVEHVDDGKNSTLAGAFDVQYPPPVVTGISPASGNRGQTLTGVAITGTDFRGPAGNILAELKNGDETITGTVTGVTATQITASFTIPAGATIGQVWDVLVQHLDDSKSNTLADAFDVQYPAPTFTSISPNAAMNTGTVNVTDLKGTNFRAGASVHLERNGQADIQATNESVVSSSKVTCKIPLAGATPGAWNVCVTNDDGKHCVQAGAFTIQPPSEQSV